MVLTLNPNFRRNWWLCKDQRKRYVHKPVDKQRVAYFDVLRFPGCQELSVPRNFCLVPVGTNIHGDKLLNSQ
jgi:hypothetical protein